MPLLTEENLDEICSYQSPLPIPAPTFCSDVATVPQLLKGRVICIDRRRKPARPWHEYLILCVVDVHNSPDIFVRLDRGRDPMVSCPRHLGGRSLLHRPWTPLNYRTIVISYEKKKKILSLSYNVVAAFDSAMSSICCLLSKTNRRVGRL
jgi:hypothetical protein